MKFESEKRAHLWAKLQTLATHVKHRAVRTVYHTTEKENIPCWTVVIERSARERKGRTLPMSYRRGMIRFLEPHRD